MNRQRNSYTVEEKLGRWVKALPQVPYPSHSQKNTRSIVRQNGFAVNYPNIKSKMAEILDKNWAKAKFHSENTDLAVISGGLTTFKKCGISNCLLGSEDYLIYATGDESDKDEIEDFDDGEEEKFDEDNKDEEFDENEEFNEIKESNKDDEYNGDESDSDKSDGDESDGNESNNRVGKWPECFVIVEKLCK
ncbi:39097_t:CDS:2, partial [Gigaspora margarita]